MTKRKPSNPVLALLNRKDIKAELKAGVLPGINVELTEDEVNARPDYGLLCKQLRVTTPDDRHPEYMVVRAMFDGTFEVIGVLYQMCGDWFAFEGSRDPEPEPIDRYCSQITAAVAVLLRHLEHR